MKIYISLSVKELILDKEDLKALKADPQSFADSLYLSDLVTLLKTANAAYHNQGRSQLTDKQYDILLEELRSRKPEHPFLKQVGAPAEKATRSKVTLPYPLFSLDKIKPGQDSFNKWVGSHKGPYVISDKEDGLSLEVIYEKGQASKAYTRGNGTVGQDVSHLIPKLGVPLQILYKNVFVVRLEVVMGEEVFNKKFSKHNKDVAGKYDNPRNLVAGVVNTIKTNHEALDHIHHLAYEIIEPRMQPSKSLQLLKQYGFKVVPYKVVDSLSEQELVKYLAFRKAKSSVGIDGLVIEQDKKTARSLDSNPDHAVAFKVTTDEDIAITKVIEVIWQASKYGVLKPVVIIEPVRLGGATIKKCSGFNAKFIETGSRQKDTKARLKVTPIGPGAEVKITRSGEVIPHIIEVTKAAKRPDMPDVEYEYNESGVDIVLVDSSDDSEVQDKLITSFFTKLGIDYIKSGVVSKMARAGLDNVIDIIKASPEDFLQVEGFKSTLANKVYQAIQDKVSKPIPLSVLMPASGLFTQGMGERRVAQVLKVYPDILDMYKTQGEAATVQAIIGIPGFQAKTAKVFVAGLPNFIKWLKKSGLKTIAQEVVKTTGTSLKGQAVAFTGFRDPLLEDRIKVNSGSVTSGVTKETTILLVKDKNSSSSKVDKAVKQGVTIMTTQEFLKKYGI